MISRSCHTSSWQRMKRGIITTTGWHALLPKTDPAGHALFAAHYKHLSRTRVIGPDRAQPAHPVIYRPSCAPRVRAPPAVVHRAPAAPVGSVELSQQRPAVQWVMRIRRGSRAISPHCAAVNSNAVHPVAVAPDDVGENRQSLNGCRRPRLARAQARHALCGRARYCSDCISTRRLLVRSNSNRKLFP